MDVFNQAALRSFEDRMVEHLRRFAPKHFKVLEEKEIRGVIRQSNARAQSHGFTSERSLRFYAELTLMLGMGFDSDPQMPWAAEIINDKELTGERERIDRLYERAWEYVNHVVLDFRNSEGVVDPAGFVEGIRQLRGESEEVLQPSDMPDFYQRMMSRLEQAFPKKCEYIGELCLRRLIGRALDSAQKYSISIERGLVIFVLMAFLLGSGFDTDPQLPWVATALSDKRLREQSHRVDKLYAAALDCLKRWWA